MYYSALIRGATNALANLGEICMISPLDVAYLELAAAVTTARPHNAALIHAGAEYLRTLDRVADGPSTTRQEERRFFQEAVDSADGPVEGLFTDY